MRLPVLAIVMWDKELSPVRQINVAVNSSLSGQLKLLGVTLDMAFSFDGQTKNVCKASFFHIRTLRQIRPSITEDIANCVACSHIQSCLYYTNSLYTGMSSANFDKLQWIQIMLARVVTLTKKRDHISPILKQLHWLLIRQRIDYNVSLLPNKIRQSGEPENLRELLTEYVPTENLLLTERKDLVTKLVAASSDVSCGIDAHTFGCHQSFWLLQLSDGKSTKEVDSQTSMCHVTCHIRPRSNTGEEGRPGADMDTPWRAALAWRSRAVYMSTSACMA